MSKTATAVATTANEPQLPAPVARRGIDEAQWRTLSGSLYPGAKSESILMAVDYCRARKLDPMKKPCHIVPMRVKNAKTGEYEWRDVILPGIYEYRTTAIRTGLYLGHSRPEYGPITEFPKLHVQAPEWCDLTAFRWSKEAQQKIEFPVRVLFAEVVATNKEGRANDRWSKAPVQMLTKCAEAAALREAFPDEFGGEPTFEEMEGRELDVTPARTMKPQTTAPRALEVIPPSPAPEQALDNRAIDAEIVAAEEAERG